MKNIAIVILAAGKSSRMNSIKQLEKINNKTLLELTLEKVKSIFSENIFCVLGANADKIKSEINIKNVEFITNENFENGLSSSIITSLNYFKSKKLHFDGIFILLADQPAIETSYLEAMLHLFQTNDDIIIASNYGKKLGVPVIFPEKHFSSLLLIEGNKGAKEFINKRKREIICPQQTTNLFDIDTKEDLQHYKNSILK
ncbi:nucleotidyltransferase family protein [Polaribacter sp. SA4-12]|uniref:nucleotidyltransferase family protein n=1 Tax=Polaribacter sp. SA4-12 TaxID=1312072 RepID=UPI000B3BE2C9|nr:nucleotidyltransferase family protein [Polaribacter sp. SA4-12]ARV16878.1 glycosyl transferase [Polaribacter sp. SA4-12]